MRRIAACLLFFAALPLAAQQANVPTSNFPGIEFSWPQEPNQQPMNGFGHPAAEVGRFDTLNINVTPAFTSTMAQQLGGAGGSTLVTELAAFTELARALKNYTDVLSRAVAAHPDDPEAVLDDPAFKKASTDLGMVELQFAQTVKPIDPELYRVIGQSFVSGGGYKGVAQALQQGIDALNARLQASIANAAEFGMTATLIPREADARALHLPGYDTNDQRAVAAVPNLIPVVDARTQAELDAAQTLAQTTMQLAQVPAEVQKTIADARASLDALKASVLANLDTNLAAVQAAIESSANANVPLLARVKAARSVIANLTSANPTLAGDTDAQRLLNLAGTLNTTVDALASGFATLPADLVKLVPDIEAAVKSGAIALQADVVTSLKSEVKAFADKQTFFLGLMSNLKKLADQFGPNSLAVISAERLAATARAVAPNASLSTSLDLSRIAGDVHVQDNVEIDAALYRRDAAGKLQTVSEGHQSFVVARYGLYPDNVRGGLIFVQPRTKIERDISYQPTIALGYYWRYGRVGHPAWNSGGPSFGFTLTLLDFKDSANIEIGIGAGVSLLRDLLWTGYGRNLQARANYFYVGVNALALGKMIANRPSS